MATVLMTIIVSYTLVYVGVRLQETGQDSDLRFYCNLLTDHVIAIQKGKDSTAYPKKKKKKKK